jgi:hypothetical protein
MDVSDVEKAEGALSHFSGAIGRVATTAAGFVLGKAITDAPRFFFNAAQAAADDAASMGRLQQAVENSGASWDSYGGRINEAISSGQKLAFSDDDIRGALTNLTQETGSSEEALHRLHTAQDLARGSGLDLSTASRLLGKVTDESANVLKRYGISVEKGASAQDLLNKVDARFGGQAAKFAQSGAGQWAIFKDQLGEVQEQLGYHLLPLFTALGSFLVSTLLPVLFRLADAVGNRLTGAFDAVSGIIGRVTPVLSDLGNYFRAVVDDGDYLNDFLTHLPTPMQGVVEAGGKLVAFLHTGLGTAFTVARNALSTFAGALSGNWTDAPGIDGLSKLIGSVGVIISRDLIPAGRSLIGVFRDLAAGPLGDFVGGLVSHFGDLLTVLNPVGSFLRQFIILWGDNGLAGALRGIPDILGNIAGSFQTIGGLFVDLGVSIGTGFLDAIKGVDWGAVVASMWQLLGQALSAAQSITLDLGGAFVGAVTATDWSGVAGAVWSGLGAALSAAESITVDLGSAFISAVTSTDWSGVAGAVWSGLGTALSTTASLTIDLGSAFIGLVTTTDWAGVAGSVWGFLGDAMLTAWSGIVDATQWFGGILTGTDWVGLAVSVWTFLGTALSTAWTGIVDAASWFIGIVTGVDWTGIAGTIWSGLSTALSTTWAGIVDLASWFKAAADSTDWSAVGSAIVTGIKTVIQAGADIGQAVIDNITNPSNDYDAAGRLIGAKITQGMNAEAAASQPPPEATGWFGVFNRGADDVAAHFSDMASGIKSAGAGLGTFLDSLGINFHNLELVAGAALLGLNETAKIAVESISGGIGRLEGDIGTVGPIFGAAFGEAGALVNLFKADVSGDFDAVIGAAEKLWSYIRQIPGIFGAAFGEAGSLVSLFQSDVTGDWDTVSSGAETMWHTVAGAVSSMVGEVIGDIAGLPGAAVSAIGDLSSTLYSAGTALVQGLANGILDAIPTILGNAIGAIGSALSNIDIPHWSSIEDAGPHMGQALVGGIAGGITGMLPAVNTAMGGLGQILSDQATAIVNASHDTFALSGDQIAQALIDGITAKAISVGTAVGHVSDSVAQALDQMQQDLIGKIDLARISGAAPDDIAKLQGQLNAVTTLLVQWAQSTGSTVTEALDSIKVSDQLVGMWQSALDNLGNVISGKATTDLQDKILQLNNELAVAVAAGAPQAVIDGLNATLAATQAQLTVVGAEYAAAVQQGLAGGITPQDVSDAISQATGLADGSLLSSLEDKLGTLNHDIAIATAEGWSTDIIQAMKDQAGDLSSQLADVSSQMSQLAAAGLLDAKAQAAWDAAMGNVAKVAVADLQAVLPKMKDFGVSLIGQIVDGVNSGTIDMQAALDTLNGMVSASLGDLNKTNDLAVSDIITKLQDLEQQYTGQLAQAIISGNTDLESSLNAAIGSIDQMLQALSAQAQTTAQDIRAIADAALAAENAANGIKTAFGGGGGGGPSGGGLGGFGTTDQLPTGQFVGGKAPPTYLNQSPSVNSYGNSGGQAPIVIHNHFYVDGTEVYNALSDNTVNNAHLTPSPVGGGLAAV